MGATVKMSLDKFNENQNYIGEADGTINAEKHALKLLANMSVAAVHSRYLSSDGQTMIFENIDNINAFNRTAVMAIMSQGGSVENYPMWVKLTVTQVSESVPNGIPGQSYTDENEVTVIRTWQQWADANGREVQTLTDGTKAIELSNGKNYFGSTEFGILFASGIPFLDKNELKALLPVESPE